MFAKIFLFAIFLINTAFTAENLVSFAQYMFSSWKPGHLLGLKQKICLVLSKTLFAKQFCNIDQQKFDFVNNVVKETN